MTFISITRLRLRSVRFLPGFLVHSGQAIRQLGLAPGFRGGSLLADRSWAFWTATAWDSEGSMRAYMLGGAHRAAMPRFAGWCDEGSVVHWEQASDALPAWAEADRRMRSEGRPSRLRDPSPRHASLTYRPPRTMLTGPIRAARHAAASRP